MAGALRHALVDDRLPENFAVLQVDSVDDPAMRVSRRLELLAAKVQTFLGGRDFAFADAGGDKESVPPDDRGRQAAARNFDLPGDILSRAPRLGQACSGRCQAGSARSAKLRPIVLSPRAGTCSNTDEQDYHEVSC